MSGNNGDVFTRVWNDMPYKSGGYAGQSLAPKKPKSVDSQANTVNMIRVEKCILCPIYGGYHPVSKCAECSHLRNRVDQVLHSGQTIEHVFCSYDEEAKV